MRYETKNAIYFHVDKNIIVLFYSSVKLKVLLLMTVWLQWNKKHKIVKRASKILGIDIDPDKTCKQKVRSKAEAVKRNIDHPCLTNLSSD